MQFNDMLLVCSKLKLAVIAKFKVKGAFSLKDVWVCGFYIYDEIV